MQIPRIALLSIVAASLLHCEDDDVVPENPADMPYDLTVKPDDFVSDEINGNTFFPFIQGKTFIYEGKDEGGKNVRVTEEHLAERKVILGINCAVIRAREYVNNELIEDTYDWYAQDKDGNVWYFGEDTKEIEKGKVIGTGGSWEAGVKGALPGVVMFSKPYIGTWYRQEYFKGEAEDVAQIISVNASVTIPYGNYSNVLQIAEWNPLEPGTMEHKFYASGVGLIKVTTVKGDPSYEELTNIE